MARVLTAGEVLPGGFRLVKLLGRGSFALVWQAEQVATGKSYAIKLAKRSSLLPMLRRQARTPVHEGIVEVHCLLHLVVNERGKVDQLVVDACHPELEPAIERAVRKWRIEPVEFEGERQTVQLWINLPVRSHR